MFQRLIARREFIRSSVSTLGVVTAAAGLSKAADGPGPAAVQPPPRGPGSSFSGEQLDQIAFPMGGIGAGMICLEGTGSLTNVSVRNQPMVQNQPGLFAALSLGGPE